VKRKCLGCGMEFEGKDSDLCPRVVGVDQSCGCLSESVQEKRKPAKKAEGEIDGGN